MSQESTRGFNPDSQQKPEVRPNVEESVKKTLLSQLPSELRERWQNASVQEINKVLETRRKEGYEKLNGYHTSNSNLEVGAYIRPGSDGTVHYTTSPDTLYGKKAKYLYIIEGSSTDKINDEALGWRQSKAAIKILDKIDLTGEDADKLETSFANVEYSG